MNMSKPLSEEEKRQNQLQRDERKRIKDSILKLDERSYEILRILRDAPNHPEIKYNAGYFAKHFKVSEPTIYRAIHDLRENNILEDENTENGSYTIKTSFEDYFYSEETKKNIALVASLRGLLQQFENTPLYESVTKLIYFLQPEVAKNDAVLSSGRIIVSPQMKYDVNLKNWDKVYEALQKNLKIKFRYMKSYSNNNEVRTVWPYQLIFENGSIYMFAYSENKDLVVLYDLNFMKDIVVTQEEFTLPEKFDFNDYSGGGRLGAFIGYEIEQFKIKFTGYAKDWIKQHKLADDQQYTESDDSTVITFSSNQGLKIFEYILNWGRQAKPLEPEWLVKRWKEEIQAMAEMIKS